MKTLFLMRHAKSDWSNPRLRDYDRPLNKRGTKNAPEMASRLNFRKVAPDLVISSGALRALITAKTVCEHINYPLEELQTDDEMYMAGVNNILEIIKSVPDKVDSLMLFGHNPGLTDLCNYLSKTEYIDNIPTAGYVEFQFDVSSWKEVSYQSGQLKTFDFPKNDHWKKNSN